MTNTKRRVKKEIAVGRLQVVKEMNEEMALHGFQVTIPVKRHQQGEYAKRKALLWELEGWLTVLAKDGTRISYLPFNLDGLGKHADGSTKLWFKLDGIPVRYHLGRLRPVSAGLPISQVSVYAIGRARAELAMCGGDNVRR